MNKTNTPTRAAVQKRHGRTIGRLACGWLMLGSGVALAQNTGNATINVTGNITGGSCAITTPAVNLGRHNRSEFTGVGTFTPWINFVITSQGCSPDIVSLHMGFNGNADTNNTNVFAVAPGGATGLGIQLQGLDAGNTLVIPNSTTQLVHWAPVPTGGTYPMRARYLQTTAAVTPGPANGTVTVMLSYN